MAVVGGAQVSVNNSGDITGFGVKAGAGINAGAVVEKPIAGFAIEEDKGFVKTGVTNAVFRSRSFSSVISSNCVWSRFIGIGKRLC